jgi:hypothetical protein
MKPYLKNKLGMMMQLYNLSYLKEDRRIMIQGQPCQKQKTLSEKTN